VTTRDNPTPELISAAYCALEWIDRKTDTGRRAAERLERALAALQPPKTAVRDERVFPILQPPKGGLRSLPWAMLEPHEYQAKANHDQSLQRLAERGGLSAIEAVAVLRGVSYREVRGMTEEAADIELRAMLTKKEGSNV
jgi:hypothetical protein